MSFSDFHRMHWNNLYYYRSADEEQRKRLQELFSLDDFLEAVFHNPLGDQSLNSHTNNRACVIGRQPIPQATISMG